MCCYLTNENSNFGWFDLIILLIHATPNIWGPRLVGSPLVSDPAGLGSGARPPVSPGLWEGLRSRPPVSGMGSRGGGAAGRRAHGACHLVRVLVPAGLAACRHGGSKSSPPPGLCSPGAVLPRSPQVLALRGGDTRAWALGAAEVIPRG